MVKKHVIGTKDPHLRTPLPHLLWDPRGTGSVLQKFKFLICKYGEKKSFIRIVVRNKSQKAEQEEK